MKVLLFCAPSGEIMFVSRCFMGGTSDVTTVLKGDVVKLIEFGDEFLTDKGKCLRCLLTSFCLPRYEHRIVHSRYSINKNYTFNEIN